MQHSRPKYLTTQIHPVGLDGWERICLRYDLYVIQLNVSFGVLNNCKLNDRCVSSVNENTMKKV